MRKSLIVPMIFLALLTVGAYRSLQQAGNPAGVNVGLLARKIEQMRVENPPQDPGVFPREWIHGAGCVPGPEPDDDPPIQVHEYNEDFYILRVSKCQIFEAPFLYLIFGEEKALLMDTGANASTPVKNIVSEVVRQWLIKKGRSSIPLIVAHTHHHFDHIAGDAQFVGLDYLDELVAPNHNAAMEFWGFEDFPRDVQTIDLGNRVIDVIGSPGHEPSSVTLYDRRTQLLITADIVYPGHLFIFSNSTWPHFIASMARLVDWAATHPVQHVLGCHIEMSTTPGAPYAYGTALQPDEHTLEFQPTILTDIYAAALSLENSLACTIFDEFVIHPVHLCGITWNG